MAKVAIRAKETSTTTGTGTYSLSGAASGFQKFLDDSNISSGNQVYYLATTIDFDLDVGKWEIGIGTITTGDTLSRDTILATSDEPGVASPDPISWSAGTKDIVGIVPATAFMIGLNNLSEVASPATSRSNLGCGDAAAYDTGTGNGLDADTIDTYHAAAFPQKASAETITGAWIFQGANDYQGDQTFKGKNDFNQTGGRVILPVGTDLYN